MNCNQCWPRGGPNPPNTWSRTNNPCISNSIYSKYELDMRRKAEVLQYKKNSTNISKKQRFSYISRNPIGQNINQVTPVQQSLFNYGVYTPPAINVTRCINTNNILYNPPSSSNVPIDSKNNVNLYYDINTPLTNWKTQRVFTNAGGKNIPVNLLNCTGNINSISV